MYKVFVDDKPFILSNIFPEAHLSDGIVVNNYSGANEWESIINKMMNAENLNELWIVAKDVELAFSDLKNVVRYIEAAGGYVTNNKLELLCIHRLGKWDLPKGKLEQGETPEVAAIREVEEECGVDRLTSSGLRTKTYHMWEGKKGWNLKCTYWYNMECAFTGDLIAQAEEGIEKAVWMPTETQEELRRSTYASIVDVLDVPQ